MFEKKMVPLTKVCQNGTTLQSGTKAVPKWGPSCGHENGSTLEPFRLHFFLSVMAENLTFQLSIHTWPYALSKIYNKVNMVKLHEFLW